MSLKEIISDPRTWISTIVVAMSGFWAWLTNKRNKNAVAGKDEAEADAIRFNITLQKMKLDDAREEKLIAKIEQLTKRVNDQDLVILGLKDRIKEQGLVIEECMAQINLYKTIKK